MMSENSGVFQLASSNSRADSPSTLQQQTIISASHDSHTLHQQLSLQQQQSTINVKPEPDYDYVDESGNAVGVAHNYTRNHINNDDQQQQHQEMLNASATANEQQSAGLPGGNQYHLSANNSSNAGAGGGGGGGSNLSNEQGRRTVLNNNTMQQSRQQPASSLSPPTPQQINHVRNQQHQTVVRSASPAAAVVATSWHQPSSHNQQLSTSGDQNTSTTTTATSISGTGGQQQQPQQIPPPPNNAFGILRHEQDVLYITENCIEIGRNSSTSSVHFHVAKNSFVSRKHFQIVHDPQTGDFYLICLSKNGIFVDDVFQRRSTEAVKLPKSCTFRFPSTEIRIAFESFSDKIQSNVKTVENSNVIYSPLKIAIPKQEQKSPYPSPTGTISAANSCPTSPRQGFQEYHQYNYNNNNNFQNNQEMFQPPSTSTYNEHEKPPYSYAQLIVQSISASPDKQLTLSGIYSFISKHYPYYRKEANKGWQNSIRHNLSLNRYFIKVARSQDEPGKGSFWRIDPNSEAKLIDQSYKKRRQRGSQCFRPPYGMPRSAPVSPSHIDNSRENSPLHDIVLQSAPGSPGVSYQNNHGGENNHASASSSEETSNYGSQNVVQQQSYNSHNQHNNNSSGYYSSTTSAITSGSVASATSGGGSTSGGGGGGPIGSLKRHPTISSSSSAAAGVTTTGTSGVTGNGGGSGTIIQGGGHSTNLYEEMSDYGHGADSDDCAETIKRQKYTNDVNP